MQNNSTPSVGHYSEDMFHSRPQGSSLSFAVAVISGIFGRDLQARYYNSPQVSQETGLASFAGGQHNCYLSTSSDL